MPGTIRSEFTGGEARISAAGKTWTAKLKALPSNVTAAEVTGISEPLASSLSDLDYTLLSSGATGQAATAITALVTDNERLIDDILALPMQNQVDGRCLGHDDQERQRGQADGDQRAAESSWSSRELST